MQKIILFGDSITAGYENGMTDFRLNEKIEADFPDAEVINAGIPGDTCRGALERVDHHVLRYQPDLVVVFFGANDVSDVIGIDIEEYRHNLQELVKKISVEKVILIGPPYADQRIYDKERPLEKLEAFNGVVEQLAKDNQVAYINILKKMLEGNAVSFLQQDGLHFSSLGYQLLGKLINKEIKRKEG